jgi:hypothetical protein
MLLRRIGMTPKIVSLFWPAGRKISHVSTLRVGTGGEYLSIRASDVRVLSTKFRWGRRQWPVHIERAVDFTGLAFTTS